MNLRLMRAMLIASQTFGWPGLAVAQLGNRPSPSPLAPGDLKTPIFDTNTPVYDSTGEQAKSAKTVVAEVDGRPITLGDVADTIAGLPPTARSLPFADLFPSVLDQLVRQQALVIRAHRQAIDEDATVRRKIKSAQDLVLANALVEQEISGSITEPALLERYDKEIAGKPGPEEVRVRVIMTDTEAAAKDIIDELRAGADFASLAKRSSKDSTAQNGGDTGFEVRDALTPEVGAVVFSLPPGQYTLYPVHSGSAWYVLKVEERRHQPAPAFSLVREDLRQEMLRSGVGDVVTKALANVTVREYDINGKETAASAADAGARTAQ